MSHNLMDVDKSVSLVDSTAIQGGSQDGSLALRSTIQNLFQDLFQSRQGWKIKCQASLAKIEILETHSKEDQARLDEVLAEKRDLEQRLIKLEQDLQSSLELKLEIEEMSSCIAELKVDLRAKENERLQMERETRQLLEQEWIKSQEMEEAWTQRLETEVQILKDQHRATVQAIQEEHENDLSNVECHWKTQMVAKEQSIEKLQRSFQDKFQRIENELAHAKRTILSIQGVEGDPEQVISRKVNQAKTMYEAKLMTMEKKIKSMYDDKIASLERELKKSQQDHNGSQKLNQNAGIGDVGTPNRAKSGIVRPVGGSLLFASPKTATPRSEVPEESLFRPNVMRNTSSLIRSSSSNQIHPAFEEPTTKKKRVSFNETTKFVERVPSMNCLKKSPQATWRNKLKSNPKESGQAIKFAGKPSAPRHKLYSANDTDLESFWFTQPHFHEVCPKLL